MRRLYFRIYLAVLGSLALFALLAGLTSWVFRDLGEPDPRSRPEVQFISGIAGHLLPSDASPSALNQELQFWHEQTGFGLALLSSSGKIISQAGPLPQGALWEFDGTNPRRLGWHGWHGIFAVELAGARRLIIARPAWKPGFPRQLRWLAVLFAIGLAVAISAYPVIRRLTRNLEQLQQGVAAFGQGNLGVRVAVRGRDEVGKLAETFNATAGRIEALVKSNKALLANASHELRSPLTRLRMAIETIGPFAPRPAKDEIVRNIAELDNLVDEILLASRLEGDGGEARHVETIDLAGLLAEECAVFRADLSVVPGESVLVSGDARLMRRLFRNLLENARRYGGPAPTEVTVKREQGAAIVAVCDRGQGVPEAERDKIFEPFYRLKGLSEGFGGVGLGLSLVRQIAERHGGKVDCLPRENGGTCFRVTVPVRTVLPA